MSYITKIEKKLIISLQAPPPEDLRTFLEPKREKNLLEEEEVVEPQRKRLRLEDLLVSENLPQSAAEIVDEISILQQALTLREQARKTAERAEAIKPTALAHLSEEKWAQVLALFASEGEEIM